jgi:uridylate kinase
MSAIPTHRVAEDFIRRKALRHIEQGRVVICVGGSGNPYFTTDSCAILRALELDCDIVVKATKVDGIYDKDPKKHADAVRHDSLSMHEVLQNDIRVMDQSAIAMAKDEEMPIYVCRIEDIDQITTEDIVGTFVHTKKQ